MRFLIYLVLFASALFGADKAQATGGVNPADPVFQNITITSCNGGILQYNGSTQASCVMPGLNVMTAYQNGTNAANGFVTSSNATAADKALMGGASTPSFVAVNNCSTALTYSTSTHTWGCNGSVSTGTVSPSAVGLKLTNDGTTPNTKIDLTANALVIPNSTYNASTICTSASYVIDAGTVGANGIDTGSLTTSTWYYVYAIGNGSTCAGLISTSSTAPALPGGYTFSMRLGAFPTDGSSHFYRITQLGAKAQYTVVASTNTPNMPLVVAAGTVGSITTPTYVAEQVSGNGKAFPATATEGTLAMNCSGCASGSQILAPNNNYGAAGSASNPPPCVTTNASVTTLCAILLESNSVYYANNVSSANLFALGWRDSVSAN